MNDIPTLQDIRDKIAMEYNRVLDKDDLYLESTGLFAALCLVEETLEDEIHHRDKYPVEAQ